MAGNKNKPMVKLNLDLSHCPVSVLYGVREYINANPHRFTASGGLNVRIKHDAKMKKGGLSVQPDSAGVIIRFGRVIDFFRALSRILGEFEMMRKITAFEEKAQFDTLGVMWDVSRNGVLTVEAGKEVIRRCAMMGINSLMLYAEDV